MNDTIIMDNYLLILKSNVEVFNHGTLESSFNDIQTLLKKCLNNTIDAQRRTYNIMVEHNMYKITEINKTQIKKCLKSINK